LKALEGVRNQIMLCIRLNVHVTFDVWILLNLTIDHFHCISMDALLSCLYCLYQNNENSNKRDLDVANVKLINWEACAQQCVLYETILLS